MDDGCPTWSRPLHDGLVVDGGDGVELPQLRLLWSSWRTKTPSKDRRGEPRDARARVVLTRPPRHHTDVGTGGLVPLAH